ncbi:MAG: AraC family transcriptional regulator [Flavobacteriaceae bacterium]|jgi:AraC-like DNA-binding protein|nr:AraC family transcriptional regulator [Flavobacteriaceae bacterium]
MDLKNTFKSRIRESKIGRDLYFAQIDNYTAQTDTISKPVGKRFVQFYFCTKGGATFHFENRNPYLIKEGNSLLLFHPEIDIPINISLAKKSKLVIFVITIQKLEEIFVSYKSKLSFLSEADNQEVHKEKSLSTAEKMVISQMEDDFLDPDLEEMYIALKLNELLIQYFSHSNNNENQSVIKDEKFIAQLNQIKEILVENIANSPSLKELSEEIHLSEYKIKEGFKKYFGKTISGFILDTKLEMGKEKLDLKVKQVQEIAYDLGYENPSHFIEAFKKKYGITPKQWSLK